MKFSDVKRYAGVGLFALAGSLYSPEVADAGPVVMSTKSLNYFNARGDELVFNVIADNRDYTGPGLTSTAGLEWYFGPTSPSLALTGVSGVVSTGFIPSVFFSQVNYPTLSGIASTDAGPINTFGNVASYTGIIPVDAPFGVYTLPSLDPTNSHSYDFNGTLQDLSLDDGSFVVAKYLGDANFDAKVSISDIVIMANNFNQSGKNWTHGDFTGDGTVGIGDLTLASTFYGFGVNPGTLLGECFSSSLTAVPLPSAGLMAGALGLGALGLMRTRKKGRLQPSNLEESVN